MLSLKDIDGREQYNYEHGHYPKGGSGWIFSEYPRFDYKNEKSYFTVPQQKTFMDVKRWAIVEANKRKWKSIWICS